MDDLALPRTRDRLLFLDCLRGLAAVWVVLFHLRFMPQPPTDVPQWAAPVVNLGGEGVILFFVISAFSLMYTMPRRMQGVRPLADFWLHRLFRIAPLWFAILAVSLLRDWVAYDVHHRPLEILSNATFTFNLIPTWQQSIVWAGWTIGVEMLFYAMFPLVYRFARSLIAALVVTVASVVLWLAVRALIESVMDPGPARESVLVFFVLKYLPVFMLGVAVYHLWHDHGRKTQGWSARLGGGLLLLGGLWATFLPPAWLVTAFLEPVYLEAIALGLIVLGLSLAPVRLVCNRYVAVLGTLSYSIYLLHPIVIGVAMRWYAPRLGAGASSLRYVAVTVALLTIIILLASVTYRLIEKPGLRIGKTLSLRVSPRLAAVGTETSRDVG